MSADQNDATSPPGQPATRWRARWSKVCNGVGGASRQTYCHVSTATRCVLGVTFKLLLLAYFIFCALFLTLRYGILPHIDSYKGNIEHIVSNAIGRPVTIAAIDASWRGLRPQLQLRDVAVHDQSGQIALALPQISATFSWTTVLVLAPRFENLTIVQPDLSIWRDAAGKLFVAGLPLASDSNNSAGADWLLSQREVIIRDGRLRWRDDQRGAAELALTGVNLVLHNHWREHQFALKATPPVELAAPIDVRANFYHPNFASRISDVTRWKGSLYADLRNTDLAVWKRYVDFPIEITQGIGSIRAWLDLNQTKVANFTADLQLANLSARLGKNLEPLQLAQVSGRVSANETFAPDLLDGIPTFGANGHKVTLSNFSLQTSDGFVLPPTTISEIFEPATHFRQERLKVDAKLIDLQLLSDLGARLPLAPSQRKLLADLAPRGQLKDFSVQWSGSYPDIQSYHIRGAFSGLGLQAQPAHAARAKSATQPARTGAPAIPGFANLSGQIDASEKGGRLSLASQDVVFQLPGAFADPELPISQLNMLSHWAYQKNQAVLFQIDNMDFAMEGAAGTLSGSHLIPLQGGAPGVIDFKAHLSTFDLRKIARFLPLHTAKPAAQWLETAILDGHASDIDVIARGDLADFPLHNLKPGVKPKSEFKLTGKFDGLKLNYAPSHTGKDGKSALWPLLEEVKGSLLIDRSRLEILADSGKTHGTTVSNVKAVVPDLLNGESDLEIDGNAAGAMKDFLLYIEDSPVAQWIGNVTEDFKADGNAKLGLKFALPLHHMEQARVAGALQFINNDVVLLPGMSTIYKTNGKLTFNEKGFNIEGLKGVFLGEQINAAGGTQRDGTTLVKIDGTITGDGLRRAATDPSAQRLLNNVNGMTRYAASVAVRQGQPVLTIESNLQGLALDLPAPMLKGANESWPLKFEVIGLPSVDAQMQRDEVKLSLGSVMSARYLRQKRLGHQYDWQVLSGGVGFGQSAPQPDSGLAVVAVAKSINIDQWMNFRTTISKDADGSEQPANPALRPYLDPDVIAMRTGEMLVMGKKLDNVVVGASHQQKTWQLNIAADQINGYASWNEAEGNRGLGRVTARLTTLNIPKGYAQEVGDLLESSSATKIPALDIVAEDFQLFGKRLGRLELNADNIGATVGDEWRINKLNLVNPDAELHATGNWMALGKINTTTLKYVLDINDAGQLLERFGFAGVVRGGKGKLDGDLSWMGLPFSLDIPTLAGHLQMDINSGQFLKVDPGAAKLLGVLNLQALPRRLALDFRDVFSQGFSFDNIAGTANVAQGTATTGDLKMTGVAASVLMSGSADIAKESQSLHVVVIPEINLGTASVVALAINPVIGVGSFLAQLFLRNPLMRSLTFEYNITGPWSDPQVVKLEHSSNEVGLKPAIK